MAEYNESIIALEYKMKIWNGEIEMDSFVEYLAHKRAHYYHTLYKNKPTASRKEECLSRIQMIDEYTLLLEIINHLPLEVAKEVEYHYQERMVMLL